MKFQVRFPIDPPLLIFISIRSLLVRSNILICLKKNTLSPCFQLTFRLARRKNGYEQVHNSCMSSNKTQTRSQTANTSGHTFTYKKVPGGLEAKLLRVYSFSKRNRKPHAQDNNAVSYGLAFRHDGRFSRWKSTRARRRFYIFVFLGLGDRPLTKSRVYIYIYAFPTCPFLITDPKIIHLLTSKSNQSLSHLISCSPPYSTFFLVLPSEHWFNQLSGSLSLKLAMKDYTLFLSFFAAFMPTFSQFAFLHGVWPMSWWSAILVAPIEEQPPVRPYLFEKIGPLVE